MPKKWLALIVGGCALLAAVAVWYWQNRFQSAYRSRMAQVELENRTLRSRLASCGQAAAPAPPAPTPPVHAAPQPATPSAGAENEAYVEEARTVVQLQQKLADTRTELDRLGPRVQELESNVQKLTLDNQRLTASEADLNENLSNANRQIQDLQQDLKSKSDRLLQVEIADQKLRDQNRTGEQRIQQVAQFTAELEQLQRRREGYLSAILRRYRDVTEQYRSLAGMLENRHVESPVVGSPDLSRIQNSIALAEEDLRQLTSLNTQALRIQRKLSGK